MMSQGLFFVILVITIISRNFIAADCQDKGSCEPCPPDQLTNPECSLTGRRMPIICRGRREDFRSCTLKDDQLQVLFFQLIVGVVGFLAYWGVSVRKARNLSLFDKRKGPSNTRNFLAI